MPKSKLIQTTEEETSHIIPVALLSAGISVISLSLTSLPDQNHIGFFLFHAKTPKAVKSELKGNSITIQITLSDIVRFSFCIRFLISQYILFFSEL
jgi:hypothetical protein